MEFEFSKYLKEIMGSRAYLGICVRLVPAVHLCLQKFASAVLFPQLPVCTMYSYY